MSLRHISLGGVVKIEFVAGSGQVDEYCSSQGYVVAQRYNGPPLEYDGAHSILVTDADMGLFEFYYTMWRLLFRGVTLVGTKDFGEAGKVLEKFVRYLVAQELLRRRRERKGGRQPYGFHWRDGQVLQVESEMEMVREVFRLRDQEHKSYREIAELLTERGYRTRGSREITISTVQGILRNRERYR